jgi:hypothetical protein
VLLKQFGWTSDRVPYHPDDVARMVLSEVAFEVDEVRRLPHWRTLPLPLIRALKRIKIWLSPVGQIVDQVSDSELQRCLREWLEIRPLLP